MLASDEKRQECLTWVDQKSRSVEAPYKVAAIRAFYFALALAPELQRKLQELQDQLSEVANAAGEQFKQWWQTQGKAWTEALGAVMTAHRNIGHDWQFSAEQKDLLRQYNAANLLLVECLNTSYVNKETRQQIESELLLPIHRLQAN